MTKSKKVFFKTLIPTINKENQVGDLVTAYKKSYFINPTDTQETILKKARTVLKSANNKTLEILVENGFCSKALSWLKVMESFKQGLDEREVL